LQRTPGHTVTGIVQIQRGGKPLSQRNNKRKRTGRAHRSAVATENITVLLLTDCHEILWLEKNQGYKKHRKRILKEQVQREVKGDRRADRIKKNRGEKTAGQR